MCSLIIFILLLLSPSSFIWLILRLVYSIWIGSLLILNTFIFFINRMPKVIIYYLEMSIKLLSKSLSSSLMINPIPRNYRFYFSSLWSSINLASKSNLNSIRSCLTYFNANYKPQSRLVSNSSLVVSHSPPQYSLVNLMPAIHPCSTH